MPAGVFVDTNVLLYAISSQPEEKVRQVVREIFVPSAGADPRKLRVSFLRTLLRRGAHFASPQKGLLPLLKPGSHFPWLHLLQTSFSKRLQYITISDVLLGFGDYRRGEVTQLRRALLGRLERQPRL